jgi:hypothetical protein
VLVCTSQCYAVCRFNPFLIINLVCAVLHSRSDQERKLQEDSDDLKQELSDMRMDNGERDQEYKVSPPALMLPAARVRSAMDASMLRRSCVVLFAVFALCRHLCSFAKQRDPRSFLFRRPKPRSLTCCKSS